MSTISLKGNWNYPTTVWFGCGRIKELPTACRQLGINNPLIVTDKGLAALPVVDNAVEILKNSGLAVSVFSDVKPNPNGENVTAGVECFNSGGHDGVIAFGGGSALDAGKAIALMTGQTLPIWEFEDAGDNWTRVNVEGMAPVIALPTTSGTGSEVGRASLIVDDDVHVKKIIFHPRMMPSIVIDDPELTVGLPRHITAATGMDALSHNLEAYCSPGFHPMADGIAMEGIRLVFNWLEIACNEPDNLEARSHMMIASTMGATAFQKGLGAMHALAHPLGAIYDAHHGLLNAILMPYVLVKNRSVIEDKICHLANCLKLKTSTFNGFLDEVLRLRKSIAIQDNLDLIGIGLDKKAEIGAMAINDPSAAGNPIQLTKEEYSDLFVSAVSGVLS